MDNDKLLQRIDSALRHSGGKGDFNDVLNRLENEKMKGNIINMNDSSKKKNRFVPIAIAAALVLAILGGFIGYSLGNRGPAEPPVSGTTAPQSLVSSVITFDVNPSIELDVDSTDTVTAVKALNDDARIVIGTMDLAGSKLDVTVNALIGSMLTNGYLDDIRNSILVSVTDGDTARASELQSSVAAMVESALGTGGLSGSVISQTVDPNAQLTELAASYNITTGKAALIEKLTAADPTLTVESLVGLSINDIALIAGSRGLSVGSLTSSGTPADGAYIGAQAALEAACAHAGVDVNSITAHHEEFDSENGRMVYEIEFYSGNTEYDYDIDALTGAVVKYSREQYNGTVPNANPGTTNNSGTNTGTNNFIGEDAAKQAAVAHAGVNSANVVWLQAQFDRDDGWFVYELEFTCDGAKYEYSVNALTGDILKSEREQFNGGSGEHQGWGQQTGGTLIGEAAAKSAALSHAGVSESDAFRLSVQLDRDDGYTVYEVEFRVGYTEYEYVIDAYSGSILKSEKSIDD